MESLSQNAVARNNNGGPTRIHQQLKANSEYKTLFADLAYKHMYHEGVLSPNNAAAHYHYKASIIERPLYPNPPVGRQPTDAAIHPD